MLVFVQLNPNWNPREDTAAPAWVNVGHITYLQVETVKLADDTLVERTWVHLTSGDDYVLVRETPDEILSLARKAADWASIPFTARAEPTPDRKP